MCDHGPPPNISAVAAFRHAYGLLCWLRDRGFGGAAVELFGDGSGTFVIPWDRPEDRPPAARKPENFSKSEAFQTTWDRPEDRPADASPILRELTTVVGSERLAATDDGKGVTLEFCYELRREPSGLGPPWVHRAFETLVWLEQRGFQHASVELSLASATLVIPLDEDPAPDDPETTLHDLAHRLPSDPKRWIRSAANELRLPLATP